MTKQACSTGPYAQRHWLGCSAKRALPSWEAYPHLRMNKEEYHQSNKSCLGKKNTSFFLKLRLTMERLPSLDFNQTSILTLSLSSKEEQPIMLSREEVSQHNSRESC
jgi:hypothetical protein